MWKLDGSSIISQFNHGVIGVHGNDDVMSAYVGDNSMIGAVSIDETEESSYEFAITGTTSCTYNL